MHPDLRAQLVYRAFGVGADFVVALRDDRDAGVWGALTRSRADGCGSIPSMNRLCVPHRPVDGDPGWPRAGRRLGRD
jgi:hypothetical protein